MDERPPQSAAECNANIEHDGLERQDRELRFQVLDAAANVEHEFIAVAVFYLGASSAERQEVVEGLIGDWGGMRAATAIIKAALEVRQAKDSETERWLQQVPGRSRSRRKCSTSWLPTWRGAGAPARVRSCCRRRPVVRYARRTSATACTDRHSAGRASMG